MTRLARYEIYECSNCHAQYRHPIWASVSVHMPISSDYSLLRECKKCGFQEKLENWIFIKELELLTVEEKKKKYEQLMFSLGVGEKPKSESIFQQIKRIFGNKKIAVKEYEMYNDIKVIK